MHVCDEIARLNRAAIADTVFLEGRRGERNSQCSGEMRRYWEEHQRRRRFSGLSLTLKSEGVGSERD